MADVLAILRNIDDVDVLNSVQKILDDKAAERCLAQMRQDLKLIIDERMDGITLHEMQLCGTRIVPLHKDLTNVFKNDNWCTLKFHEPIPEIIFVTNQSSLDERDPSAVLQISQDVAMLTIEWDMWGSALSNTITNVIEEGDFTRTLAHWMFPNAPNVDDVRVRKIATSILLDVAKKYCETAPCTEFVMSAWNEQ